MKKQLSVLMLTALAACNLSMAQAQSTQTRPNIVMIMADDVAQMDISAIHRGLGAVRTPNIDRIAKEGMTINDYYAQPSCTAGRAAFITGQYPIRTGLTTVGMPGSPQGLSADDPTLAQMLKARGYATAQFGKNHLGDRNEHLPTVHGFDEFLGMIDALNTYIDAEQPDYPKNPNFVGRRRNVLHTTATEQDDPTEDPRFGKVGKQQIEDRGPITAKRAETIDDEFTAATVDWLKRTEKSGKPFFLWYAPSRMHQPTLLSSEWKGKSGHTDYTDGLLELDNNVGKVLNQLDAMGVSKNTIVMFTSDNAANQAFWPDSGTASFRGTKGTTWDGGFRVPMLVRWPGKIPANEWTDQFMTSEDWVPTLMAAAGDPDIKQRLKAGTKLGDREFKVHLDGYNQLAMLTGNGKSQRREFFYYAETDLNAMRIDHWKLHFATKNAWLDVPVKTDGMLFDIKADPYERADGAGGYLKWMFSKQWLLPLVGGQMAAFQKSLKEFPPRQKGGGFGSAAVTGR